MKEQATSSHNAVATGTASSRSDHGRAPLATTDNNNSAKCFGGPCLDSEEDDEDWEEDLGIGKLVIDLDADADSKARSPPSVKSTAAPIMSSGTSPQKAVAKGGMDPVTVPSQPDKGLKMKIKRNGSGKSTASLTATSTVVNATAPPIKLETLESKPAENQVAHCTPSLIDSANQMALHTSAVDRLKHSLAERERLASSTGKNRSSLKKERSSKSKGVSNNDVSHSAVGGTLAVSAPSTSSITATTVTSSAPPASQSPNVISNVTVDLDRISVQPFSGGAAIKRENPSHDPYEFNAKIEDRIGVPMKKMKVEKTEPPATVTTSASLEWQEPSGSCGERRDIAVETSHVGVITEPDCLGPCEPGTNVVLEGIVWNETENGLLVVNVTWRGKTYVGTLMDATKHVWAPPRFNCDSPSGELDTRTPKGRGKRGRAAAQTPKLPEGGSDRKLRSNRRTGNSNVFAMPPSPARFESLGAKRKARSEPDPAMFEPPKPNKRSRVSDTVASTSGVSDDQLIECPEPNCNKKYRHINGLRYHQSHSHKNSSLSSEGSGQSKEARSTRSTPSPSAISEPTTNTSKKDSTSISDEEPSKKKVDAKRESKAEDFTEVKIKEEPVEKLEKIEKSKEKKDKKEDKIMEKTPSASSLSSEPKKSSKHATVSLTPVTATKTGIGSGSMVYQISGTQIGLVTTNGDVVSPTQGKLTVSSMSVAAVPVSTTSVTATALTKLPVTLTTMAVATPIVATPSPSPGKPESEKKKKDKSEKHRNKSASAPTARPIMPAPPTSHIAVSHTPISTQAGITQVSTVTSLLKPIQPKPTVLGETSKVNPALASLKEMKEKKPKKKKVPTATLR